MEATKRVRLVVASVVLDRSTASTIAGIVKLAKTIEMIIIRYLIFTISS